MLDLFGSDHYEGYEATSAKLTGAGAREQQMTSAIGRQMAFEVGWAF